MIDVVGYDVVWLPGGVMLGHLGVQLDVMGHLLEKISSWPTDAGSYDQVWELANTFYAAHLLWPADLLTTAARQAKDGFYRSSIMLTREFLKSEMQPRSTSGSSAQLF